MKKKKKIAHARVAIVTGGAHGIGYACCQALLKEGYDVAIIDINGEALKHAVSELNRPGRILPLKKNVSKEADVKSAVAAVIKIFGGLDLVVNNASHADPLNTHLERMTLDYWNLRIGVSLTGPFLFAKYAVPHLRKRGGSIINMSSTRSLMSEKNTEAYSACKGGVDALTRALAISLGPEIRVNSILPGWIDTRDSRATKPIAKKVQSQHPVGRVGLPEDIAEAVVFLASPKAGFITGQMLVVDGGMSTKMIYED